MRFITTLATRSSFILIFWRVERYLGEFSSVTFYSVTIQWKWSQRNSHTTWDLTFPDPSLPFCLLLNPKRKIQSVTHEDARLHMMCQKTNFSNSKWKRSVQIRQPDDLKAFTPSPSKEWELWSSVTEAQNKVGSTSKESSRICKGSLLSSVLIGSIGWGPKNFVTAELLNQDKWQEWTIPTTVAIKL